MSKYCNTSKLSIREINKKLVGQKIDEELFKTIRRVGEK